MWIHIVFSEMISMNFFKEDINITLKWENKIINHSEYFLKLLFDNFYTVFLLKLNNQIWTLYLVFMKLKILLKYLQLNWCWFGRKKETSFIELLIFSHRYQWSNSKRNQNFDEQSKASHELLCSFSFCFFYVSDILCEFDNCWTFSRKFVVQNKMIINKNFQLQEDLYFMCKLQNSKLLC